MRYADQFAPKAIKMTLASGDQTVKGISQMYMDCPSEKDKYDILCKLYGLMTIGSSVIFGATHFQLLQLPALTTAGLVFAFLRVRTGRLGPAILGHAAFNCITVASLVWWSG